MNIKNSFDKAAKSYQSFSKTQNEIAQLLVSKIDYTPKRLLDLGCGDGAIYRLLGQRFGVLEFVGVDFSSKLLEFHPKGQNILLYCKDYEEYLLEAVPTIDTIISNCSIQWAKEPKKIFETLSSMNSNIFLSIVTDTTFHELHELLGTKTPLYGEHRMLEWLGGFTLEKITKKLEFQDGKEMLRYIKNSGVSGARNISEIGKLKKLYTSKESYTLTFDALIATRLVS